MSNRQLGFLSALEAIIRQRLDDRPEDSYTARLAAEGMQRMAQKVGEEGVELALAATAGNRDEIVNEAADLLYHVLVLLAGTDIRIQEVIDLLESRHAD